MRACLMQIFSSLQFIDTSLSRVSNENSHLMQFLVSQHARSKERALAEAANDGEDEGMNEQPTDATI